jgi:hypothetical protein
MTTSAAPPWSVRANYWRGWRALGGRLAFDGSTLRFEPHGLEKSLGGNTNWSASIADVVSIDVARKGAVPRKRLYVRTADGREARFLVPKVEDVASGLRRAQQT